LEQWIGKAGLRELEVDPPLRRTSDPSARTLFASQSLLVDMVSPRSWWSGRGQMSSGLQGSIGAVDRKGRFARVGSGSAIEKDIRSVGKDSVCITDLPSWVGGRITSETSRGLCQIDISTIIRYLTHYVRVNLVHHLISWTQDCSFF